MTRGLTQIKRKSVQTRLDAVCKLLSLLKVCPPRKSGTYRDRLCSSLPLVVLLRGHSAVRRRAPRGAPVQRKILKRKDLMAGMQLEE